MKFEDIRQKFLVEELQELCTKVIAERDALKSQHVERLLRIEVEVDALIAERDALAAKVGEGKEYYESYIEGMKEDVRVLAEKDVTGLIESNNFNIHWDEPCKDWKVYKGTTLWSYDENLTKAVTKAAAIGAKNDPKR